MARYKEVYIDRIPQQSLGQNIILQEAPEDIIYQSVDTTPIRVSPMPAVPVTPKIPKDTFGFRQVNPNKIVKEADKSISIRTYATPFTKTVDYGAPNPQPAIINTVQVDQTSQYINKVHDSATVLRAARLYDAIVDINEKGDFTSIQNALDSGAKTIYVRNGTYQISSSISIQSSNISIIGENRNNTIIYLKDGSNCHMVTIGNGSTTIKGITIESIQLDGNKDNQTGTSYGIYVYGGSSNLIGDVKIQNCYIKNTDTAGIYMSYADRNYISNNFITDIAWEDAGDTASYGIYLVNSDENIITENLIGNTYTGIFLNGIANVITNNNIKLCYYCILTATFTYSTISSNNLMDSDCGVFLGSGSNYNIISNNEIIDPAATSSDDGVALYEADYNLIHNNNIRGMGDYGIDITDASSTNNSILGNYLVGNDTGAISDSGTGTIINHNVTA